DGALLRVLIGVTAADELDGDEGIASLRATYSKLAGRELDEAQVVAEREAAKGGGAWLDAARELGKRLDDHGKQQVIGAAFGVAVADGFVLEEEDRVLATLAAALGLSEAEYRGIVDKLLADAQGG
ncbi:MAG TPA: TerB family tellurite resistance protein, partial [Nannocystaceae bacterium]|nr:TerB family tellurite resistance protein [Nannocystaceae bacterium]